MAAAPSQNGLKKTLWGFAISISIPLLLQTGVLIYWAGAITTRVDFLDRDLTKVEKRVTGICNKVSDHIEKDS